MQDARRAAPRRGVERRRGCPLCIDSLDVGDRRLERRIDALDRDERRRRSALVISALPEHDRRGADDARHLLQLRDLGVGSRSMPPDLADVDVRRATDDAIAQLALQPGHQRQRDEQRHHADRRRRASR